MSYRNRYLHTKSSSHSAYQKTQLSNGIRIITEEISSVKSASIGIWINTGSKNETPENNGITHFIEHMVFKGTKKRSLRQIAQSIESAGGYLNAFTTKEHTCFYARVLDENITLAIDVLSDLVLNPTFPEKEILKEKSVVLEEIKSAEDDPDDQVHEYFEKNLFGSHPLGLSVIGTAATVSTFSRKQLLSYLNDWYTADRIIITAAGNVQHEKFVAMAEKYFSNSVQSSKDKQNKISIIRRSSTNTIHKPIQQAHIITGTIAFSANNPQRYAGLVMNTMLGDGMSSRLFQAVREKHGLAYSVYSYLTLLKETGIFGVYLGTDKDQIEKALSISQKELKKFLTKKVGPAELKRTKAQLKGNMLLSLESTSHRMMRLGSGELYFGEFTPLDSIVKNIDEVTVDQIQDVARKLFSVDDYTTIFLVPQN